MFSAALACALLACAPAQSAADVGDYATSCGASGKTLQANTMLQVQRSHRTKSVRSLNENPYAGQQLLEGGVEAIPIRASDFSSGTLRIQRPGLYQLTEDVEFDPSTPGMSWSKIPPDSRRYPQRGGYFLGFFAALTIEANNVVLDCQGHEMKMSQSFHQLQRFFSLIELGSSPFPHGQGPPQFSSNLTTPGAPTNANQTTIMNCKFGLSSHHAIHGNDNAGVTLRNLTMVDFEVAGLALNGASKVHAEQLQIGPSLQRTFRAGLSQAIFMDHLANTLMEQDPIMRSLKRSMPVELRGTAVPIQQVFAQLGADLQTYVSGAGGPLKLVAGTGTDLPDGSAVYGVLLHRSGVAINKLGFCPDDSLLPTKRVATVVLKDIHIRRLAVRPEQVVSTLIAGQKVMGPAGDVVQIPTAWDPANCHRYVGDSFTDAQLAMGKLCASLASMSVPPEMIAFFCGGTHVPVSVRKWASGTWSCASTRTWASGLLHGSPSPSGEFTCAGDAMNHHNKGAIGMRLGFQEDISVERVVIEDVQNMGVPGAAPWCNVTGEPYEGVDARAVSLAHMKDLHKLDVSQRGVLSSTDSSRIFPVTGILQMRTDDAQA